MVDSTTVLVSVMVWLAVIFILAIFFLGFRKYYRNKKLHVKSPRLRSRNILYDSRFGSAVVIGYTLLGRGWDKVKLHLMGRDGQIYAMPVSADEIYPENPLQAFAGAQGSIWRLKGKRYPDVHVVEVEKENIELKKENLVERIKKRQAVNEAAVIPDKMEEIIKEAQKVGKVQEVRIGGK